MIGVCRSLRAASTVLALALGARPASACSMAPFSSARFPGVAHIVGTATADTVQAGRGEVRALREKPGAPAEGPVWGQVVRVERLGGLAAVKLPRGTDRVILVPWGYGADCRTVQWTGTARWSAVGARGLYTASLRDPAHWAGGVPTLDVFTPYHDPYPHGFDSWSEPGSDSTLLTIEELFDLMEILPVANERGSPRAEDNQRVLEWARTHPRLARRAPARDILGMIAYGIEYARLKSIDPPLAGTYRLTAKLTGGPQRIFYVRTRSRPTTGWNRMPQYDEPAGSGGDPTIVRASDGYSLLVAGAAEAESLPVDCGPTRQMEREGYFSIPERPDVVRAGTRTWRGEIEASLVLRQFPGDSALREFSRSVAAASYERYTQRLPSDTPARFELGPDGSVRVHQTLKLPDGRELTVEGTRISHAVIVDP